jgi:ribokinase
VDRDRTDDPRAAETRQAVVPGPAHLRFAVVGHIEWIRFARVARVPVAGEIAHATDAWEGTGGGGAVAAVQLAKLAGTCLFLSAVGEDRVAEDAGSELERSNVELHAAVRDDPTRTAITLIDDRAERTIVTLGNRLHPSAHDELPWERLAAADGAVFTAGDVGAVRLARQAGVLVATSRVMDVLTAAEVRLDVLVGSALDPAELGDLARLRSKPSFVVRTEGARGGSWESADGARGRYEAVATPGPLVDTYGAGDSFQAGLAFGLAQGLGIEGALALAARCGAYAATGRGPTRGQLTADDVARPEPDT